MFISKMVKYLTVILICTVSSCLATPMHITMMLEHEGFLMWYAQQKGWDKEVGLDLKLEISKLAGDDILNEINGGNKAWDVTVVGAVPATLYSKKLPITVFALANNESRATEIFVRPDSEILKIKGYNSKYPSVYGSPESVKGKTFMTHENTSVFYTLMMWLKILGMDLKDINYINVSVPEMVKKFHDSKADGFVIWSPDSYEAIHLGYAQAANVEDMHAFLPMVFCVHNDYAKNHTEELSKLVFIYSRACHEQEQRQTLPEMIKAYQKFLKIYTGVIFSESFCKFDLLRHSVISIDEQIEYFNEIKGISKVLEVRNNILTLYRDAASAYGWKETYDENDYPNVTTDRYLLEAQKLQKQKLN